MGAFAEGELHHKMSKKIAQLTKVIFHLNTRNEDAGMELEATRANHERQLASVTHDAAAKLSLIKHELQRKQAQIKEVEGLGKIKARHDSEKAQAMDAFQKYKKQQAKLRNDLESKFEKQVEKMTLQLNAAKASFEAKLTSLQAEHSNALSTQTELQELKDKHANEISDLVLSSNEKYNRMLTEQMNMLDAQRLASDAELKSTVARLEKQRNDQVASVKQTMEDEKAKSLLLQQEEGNAATESIKKSLISKMETLLTDLEHLRSAEKDLRSEKQSLSESLESANTRITALTQQVEEEKRDNTLLQGKLTSLASSATQSQDEISSQLQASKEKIASLTSELQTRESELQTAAAKTEKLSLEYSNANVKHAEVEARLQQLLSEKESQNEQLSVEFRNLQREISDSKIFAERQSTEKDGEIKKLEAELKNLKTFIAKLEESIVNQKQSFESQIVTLRDQNTKTSADALDGMKTQLLKSHEAQKAALLKESKEQLDKAANAHLASLQKLQGEHQSQSSKLKSNIADLTTKLEASVLAHQKAEEKTKKTEALLASSAAKHGDHVKGKVAELAALKNNMNELKKKHKDELQSAKAQLADSISSLKKEYDAKLVAHGTESRTELQNALEEQKAELQASYRLKSDTLQNSLSAKESQVQDFAVKLASQMNEASAAAEASDARHALALTELQAKCDTQLENQRQESTFKIRELVAQHEDLIKTIKTTHEEAVQTLQRDASTRHHGEMEKLQTNHADKLADILVKHDEELAKAVTDADLRRVDDLTRAQQQKHLELSNQKTQLEAEASSKIESQTKVWDGKTRLLTAEITAANSAIDNLGSELREVTQSLIESQKALQVRETEFQNQCEGLRNDAKSKCTELLARNEEQLKVVLEDHMLEMKNLTTDFENQRMTLEDEVDFMRQKLCEADARYDARESRPEDLSRISHLEYELADKDAQMKTTLNEMAYIKRELINREETYNKKFSRNPNVGLLNALKPASGGAAAALDANPRRRMSKLKASMKPQKMPARNQPAQEQESHQALPPLTKNNNNRSFRDLRQG